MTAVAPVVIQAKGIWVGWPGLLDDINEPIPESDPNDKTPTAGLLSEKVRNPSLPSDCSQTLYILQVFFFFKYFLRSYCSELIHFIFFWVIHTDQPPEIMLVNGCSGVIEMEWQDQCQFFA